MLSNCGNLLKLKVPSESLVKDPRPRENLGMVKIFQIHRQSAAKLLLQEEGPESIRQQVVFKETAQDVFQPLVNTPKGGVQVQITFQ